MKTLLNKVKDHALLVYAFLGQIFADEHVTLYEVAWLSDCSPRPKASVRELNMSNVKGQQRTWFECMNPKTIPNLNNSIPAASKGSPMDISTLLRGLHWAPLGSTRYKDLCLKKRDQGPTGVQLCFCHQWIWSRLEMVPAVTSI